MFRYYIAVILIGTLLIILLNCIFALPIFAFSPLYAVEMTLLSVAVVFLIDAAVAQTVRMLPKRLYDPFRKRYRVFRFEKHFYQKIGIRKWKDKIPETGGLLVKFQKSKVIDLHDNAYLFRFMEETCYAEVMHLWSVPLGYLALLIAPLEYALCFGIPVATVNAVLQTLPIFVQRFVRPQLMRVYLGNEKREARRALVAETERTKE